VTESSTCATLITNAKRQPTSIAVDGSNWSFYGSGVFSLCNKNLNHAVLVVGMDSKKNWIVKNSWGTGWGQQGYMTLKAGDTCGAC